MEDAKKANTDKLTLGAIRDLLWEEMHSLRAGDTSAANVSALTNASGKILSTVALELKYAQLTGQTPNVSMLRIGEKDAD